jgi:glutaredoxin
MSKKHVSHSPVAHKAESKSGEGKILGFEINVIALMAVLVILAAVAGTFAGISAGENVSKTTSVSANKTLLASNVEDFINKNFLAAQGLTAKIVDINDLGNNFYALGFDVYQGTNKLDSGVVYSSNGKLIIGNVIDLNAPLPAPTQQQNPPAETAPVKTAKPVVDLYVMSFCPYGNKAEDTMKPVYALLKDKIEFNVHYIVNVDGTTVQSLHGAKEATQNEREVCVLNNYDMNKWFEFATYVNTNCGSDGACWEAGADSLGIDKAKINDCVATQGVDLMSLEAAASNAAGANGSPTMVINGVKTNSVYQYGNSEAYKQAICNSFTSAPSECATVLSNTATTQGGSC